MADGNTTATVRCPECAEPITIHVKLTYQRAAGPSAAFDLAPLRVHIATHAATFTTELPPTAR